MSGKGAQPFGSAWLSSDTPLTVAAQAWLLGESWRAIRLQPDVNVPQGCERVVGADGRVTVMLERTAAGACTAIVRLPERIAGLGVAQDDEAAALEAALARIDELSATVGNIPREQYSAQDQQDIATIKQRERGGAWPQV